MAYRLFLALGALDLWDDYAFGDVYVWGEGRGGGEMALDDKHGQVVVVDKQAKEEEESKENTSLTQVEDPWQLVRYNVYFTFSHPFVLSSADLDFLLVFPDCFATMVCRASTSVIALQTILDYFLMRVEKSTVTCAIMWSK